MTKRRLLLALGVAISVALAAYAISTLEWPIFWQTLRSVQWPWLVAAVLATVISVAGRAFRWHFIGAVFGGGYVAFWRATTIGYLGNFVLPMRAGELIRVWALSRLSSLSLSATATSSVLDRLSDVATLCVVFGVVLLVHGTSAVGVGAIGGLVAVLSAALILIATLIFWRGRVERAVSRFGKGRWQHGATLVRGWLDDTLAVLRDSISLRRGGVILAMSLAIFATDFFVMWLVMAAFGWSLPFFAAVTFGTFLAISSSLPAAPGYIGVYQVAAIFALDIYGIEATEAVAFAVVLQLLTFSLFVALGNWSIMQSTLPIKELLRAAIPKTK